MPSQAAYHLSIRKERELKLSPKPAIKVAICSLIFLMGASVWAQMLTGTITNGTSNKPAAGDEVVLIKLASGMEEVGHTKADAQGKFSFKLDDNNSPHLIRAIHQDVTYHRMAPPGTTSVDLQVFDVAKKLEGISVTADVLRIQTEDNQLETIRLFAVNNTSNPPKTQMSDHNFEFYLPDGAKIAQSMARTANGQPINSEPIPQKEKNRYAFNFPLRPGETQFQIAYQMPYTGSADLQPKTVYPIEHFVVMVPKSMKFEAGAGAQYQSMDDPQQSDATVEVAQRVEASSPLGFKISGSGTIAMNGTTEGTSAGTASAGGGTMGAGTVSGRDARQGPGGGLGPPIDAPDPLQKYRWPLLGVFAVLLAAGAWYVSSQRTLAAPGHSMADLDSALATGNAPAASVPVRENRAVSVPVSSAAPATTSSASYSTPAASPVVPAAASTAGRPMILAALKEELFELELEHKQGRISQAEYEKAKAALDATLERALKREAQKT
jgi:hypothetical protein